MLRSYGYSRKDKLVKLLCNGLHLLKIMFLT